MIYIIFFFLFLLFKNSFINIWAIATIGTDMIIQTIPNKLAHIIIAINTEKEDNARFFHMIYGTSRLFSSCWIVIYNTSIIIVALKDIHNHMASAGINAINGHIYGMNSIIHAITDRIKNSSIFTQKILMNSSQKNVITNILIASNIWLFNQLDRVSTIAFSFFNKYLDKLFGIIS